MISQLSGRIVSLGANWAVLDVNGVGIRFSCPPSTAAALRPQHEATVQTSLVVREDSLTLFGFADSSEREAFEMCQSASGVGPKLALAMVSVLGPGALREAIVAGSVSTLRQVPGIGVKGAQKIILELKDKMAALEVGEPSRRGVQPVDEQWREQVAAGLVGLGWSARDAEAACDAVAPIRSAQPQVSVAELLRAALQSLARL